MICYRIADTTDIEQLSELRWLHELEYHDLSSYRKDEFTEKCASFLKANFENETYVCWVAEESGKIISNIFVGVFHKIPRPEELTGRIGYVTNVHTLEAYRNKGIGGKLMENVKLWAVNRGIELLFVWPSERTVPFYERHGFKNENEIMECLF